MVLLGVVTAMVTGLYLSASRAVAQAKTLTGNTREASNGMNETARVIRAATENPVAGALNAPAIETASNESVTLYAYVNLGMTTQQPVKIRLAVDANRRLVETRWASTTLPGGYFGFQATPQSSRILAETVAPWTSPKLYVFTYIDSAGAAIPVSSGSLTTAERRRIAAVTVTLTLQASTTDARSAVTLQNTVGMPNVGLSGDGS
jgi:hypothetical protein